MLPELKEIAGLGADVLNMGLGIANQDYQKKMQQEAWRREDTAVQRRVADLRAAGLSPTLAAGSAAASSGPINVGVPKFDTSNVMHAVEYGTAKKQNAVTDAQLNLVNAQIDATDANSFIARAMRDYFRNDATGGGRKTFDYIDSTLKTLIEGAREKEIGNNVAAYNAGIAANQGVPVTSGSLDAIGQGKMIDNALSNPSAAAGPLAGILKALVGIFK